MLKKVGGEIVNNGFTALGSGLKAEREKKLRTKGGKAQMLVSMPFTTSWRFTFTHRTNWVQTRSASGGYKGKAVTAKSERDFEWVSAHDCQIALH